MSATALMERLHEQGNVLRADGDVLCIQGPRRSLSDDIIDEIRNHKPALLDVLKRRYRPGGRYRLGRSSPIERIFESPPSLREWAEKNGYPRAGIVTVDGETLLIADVTELLNRDLIDVLGVAPDGWAPPPSVGPLIRPKCGHPKDWRTENTAKGRMVVCGRCWSPRDDEGGRA
jgi:hypothetical protein